MSVTDPQSPPTEGRNQSRRNALKHGLSGAGVVLPPDLEADVARREADLAAHYRPRNDDERRWVREIALGMARVDACFRLECQVVAANRERDLVLWDADREHQAERLSKRLGDDPALTVLALRRFTAGCEWLLARWRALAVGLEGDRCAWTADDLALALNLTGVATALRHLDPTTRALADDWLFATAGEGPEPAEALKRLRAVVQRRIAELNEHADCLFELESRDYDRLLAGHRFDFSPAARSVRRLEADARRLADRAQRQLDAARHARDHGASAHPERSGPSRAFLVSRAERRNRAHENDRAHCPERDREPLSPAPAALPTVPQSPFAADFNFTAALAVPA